MEKVYDAIGMNETERAQELLRTLKANIDMGYTRNRQMVERLELDFDYQEGKISKKEYVDDLKKIIGYSVKYENFFRSVNVYLTDSEASMLQMLYNLEKDNDGVLYLHDMLSRYERKELYIRKIELIQTAFASDSGNRGVYDSSNMEFLDVIKENFRIKRIYNIARCTYGIWWNNDMQHKYSTDQNREMLNICVDISDFAKEYMYKQFFLKKLDSILGLQ